MRALEAVAISVVFVIFSVYFHVSAVYKPPLLHIYSVNRALAWIFPYCGKQEDNIIYLPVDVDVPLKVSGLSCLRLER